MVNLLPGLQQDQQDIRDPTRVEEAGTAAVQQEAVSAGGAVSNPRQQQQQLPQEALAREIEDLNSRRDKVGEESEEDSNQDMLEQILM